MISLFSNFDIGDLQDEEAVLGFLTSEDSLTIPDKIEEVNAEYLTKIVSEEKYVTVLFFDESKGIFKYEKPC